MIFLHHFLKLILALFFTGLFYYLYPSIILTILFFYISMPISGAIVNCVFYFFTKPRYLKQVDEI